MRSSNYLGQQLPGERGHCQDTLRMRPNEYIPVRSSGPHPDRHPCLRRSWQWPLSPGSHL